MYMVQNVKSVMDLTSWNIIEIWCGAVKLIPSLTPQGLKLLRVNYAPIPSNTSTTKANTWQIITNAYFGGTALIENSISRNFKRLRKPRLTQFA